MLVVGSRYTSDDSPTVTQTSLSYFLVLIVFLFDKTKRQTIQENQSQRLIATPAIRTLKIRVFYPKNNQKSQILSRLGTRHTSDDSPTVTQTSLSIFHLLVIF